jgi:hypothetical protein
MSINENKQIPINTAEGIVDIIDQMNNCHAMIAPTVAGDKLPEMATYNSISTFHKFEFTDITCQAYYLSRTGQSATSSAVSSSDG